MFKPEDEKKLCSICNGVSCMHGEPLPALPILLRSSRTGGVRKLYTCKSCAEQIWLLIEQMRQTGG